MAQRGATDVLGAKISIRDLKSHPDRQSEIGEIPVVRWVIFVEVDACTFRARPVEEARIAQRRTPCVLQPMKATRPTQKGRSVPPFWCPPTMTRAIARTQHRQCK